MTADPLAYTDRDDAIISCATCDRDNVATIWSDIRSGEWGYEFDCIYCGNPNTDHQYGPADDGHTEILFVLYIAALAFIVWGALGRAWWVIFLGAAIFAFTLISARVAASGRNRS